MTANDFLDYRMQQGGLRLRLHPPIVVKAYLGQCAVSRKGHVRVAEIESAIGQIVRDGTIGKIIRRYQ